MREMGFTYDPSTAGSSVRFDPPDSRDPVSVCLLDTHLAVLISLPFLVCHLPQASVISSRSQLTVIDICYFIAHPDETLYPVKLKEFGKKLKRTYGWSEEDFYRKLG